MKMKIDLSKLYSSFRQRVRKVYGRLRISFDGKYGPLPSPDKWVFIAGCYNSGTTLVHDMLALHPEVASMPTEGHFLTNQLLSPKSLEIPRLWATEPNWFYLDENSKRSINVNKLKRQWGARFNDRDRAVLLEKSPSNAARVRWLQKNFDNAYFIGIIRNGYAVAEGIRRKAGHSIKLAALQWRQSNEIMLRDFEVLRNKKLIRYESLTESPDSIMSEIIEFLELDRREIEINGRIWKIHEKESLIENMDYRSIEALSEADIAIIQEVSGDLLERLGYGLTN